MLNANEAQLLFARRELASHVAAARSIMSGAVVRTPVADGCAGDSGEERSTADTGDDQQAYPGGYPRREHELLMMMTQETVDGRRPSLCTHIRSPLPLCAHAPDPHRTSYFHKAVHIKKFAVSLHFFHILAHRARAHYAHSDGAG